MSACITRRRLVAPVIPSLSRTTPMHYPVANQRTLSQATRVRALQRAYRKAEAANPRSDAPKAGAIRNLGLLGQDEDTKDLLSK